MKSRLALAIWMLLFPIGGLVAVLSIPVLEPRFLHAILTVDFRFMNAALLLVGSVPLFFSMDGPRSVSLTRLAAFVAYMAIGFGVLFVVAISVVGFLYGRYL